MDRRRFLISGLAAVIAAGAAHAESYADGIVRQLRRQGFDRIIVSRTLLGRIRIVASGSEGSREIIVNPRTGEILRDLWTATEKSGSRGREIIDDKGDDRRDGDDNSGSGSSHSGSGSNSGSGSSNSGSGSGNSGSGGGDDDDDD